MGQVNEATFAYREWYAAEPERFPLFHTPWWLDTVCGPEAWMAIRAGRTSASEAVFLPLTFGRKYCLRGIKKPLLTPFLGPLWVKGTSSRKQLHLMQELVAALPSVSFFQTTFRPGESSALPFQWQGYQLRTRFTFQLTFDGVHSPFSNAGRDVSRRMRKDTTKALRVESSEDMNLLYGHLKAVFTRQGSTFNQHRAKWLNIGTSLLHRKQGVLLIAKDDRGQVLASQLIGWDNTSIYLLATGSSEKGRDVDAYYRIIGEMPRFFPSGKRTIDFCGSMLPGVAEFNAGLGARAVPYQEIRKISLLNW